MGAVHQTRRLTWRETSCTPARDGGSVGGIAATLGWKQRRGVRCSGGPPPGSKSAPEEAATRSEGASGPWKPFRFCRASGLREFYVLSDQNAARHDDPGFAAIGSGSTFGRPDLAAPRVNTGIDLELALYAAYEAKRVSEEVGTVGRQTDMAIVSVGQTERFLWESLVSKLEDIYQRRLILAKSDKNTIRRAISM
jgi:hypothetical protein